MARFRHIPPTQFLKGFEAAARLESFSRAAAELGLTQSAISHQMRLLEGHLGQPLFLRVGREVRLTDAGRDYQRTVRRCLDLMEEGYRRLEPYRKPGSIVIYAPHDFARRWLLHRLPRLKAAVPTCEPWLDTSGASVDFDALEVDIAIVYTDHPPENRESLVIARDSSAPVLAPALSAGLKTPADLLALPILHDERDHGWADWLRLAGIETDVAWKGSNFSDGDLALAAAELGQGAALASLPLAQAALAAGTLAQPFAETLASARAWYAVSTASRLGDAEIRAVWAWLGAEGTAATEAG